MLFTQAIGRQKSRRSQQRTTCGLVVKFMLIILKIYAIAILLFKREINHQIQYILWKRRRYLYQHCNSIVLTQVN